ncbi:protein CASPARIAN STRIP INTEGRITY FACTOR 1-like [Euphorbia lathyris]|uniref:protein CASPARIAN STRIP INTEGRITY FACTOR 1-like n=1 Tax=Euphorbia lathyris TaxID=212925 RepID=UPI0033137433
MSPIIFMKKFFLLFLLISSSLSVSTSAGRRTKFVDKLVNKQFDATHQEVEEEGMINERMLRANNKDYGNYDPAPALVRPPFKLIPN